MQKGKWLMVLLSIILASAFVLSACSKNTEEKPEETPKAADSAAPDASAGPEEIAGKIVYSQWGSTEEINATKELIKEFNVKYPKVEVEVVGKDWGTYWTSLTAQAASKDLPDVYKMSFAYVDKYVKLGALKDLTALIKETNFNTADFAQGVLASHQVNGVQYSLPRDANTVVMYYNKALFDDAKTNPAKAPHPSYEMTWAEALDIAQKMTLDKNGKYSTQEGFDPKNIVQWGLVTDPAGGADSVLEPQLISNGAKMVNDDKSLALETPEAQEVLNWYHELVTKHHVTPTSAVAATLGGHPFTSLATGKVAMNFAGSWTVGDFKKANIQFEAILPPKFKTTQTVVQAAGNAMSPYSKNEKAAWALLSWLAGPEGQIALAKQGQSIPANTKAAETYLGMDDGYNKQAFIDSQKYAISTPFFDGKDKLLWEYVPQKLALPLSGEGDIAKAITEIKDIYKP